MRQPSRPTKVSVIAKKILSYWVEKPQASDTVDGIAVWWVQYKEFERWKPQVEKALSELVKKKLVLKKAAATSGVTYELNPEMESEVQRIVKDGAKKSNSQT